MNLETKNKKVQVQQAAASQVVSTTTNALQLTDNRPTSVTQLKMIEKINDTGKEVAQLSGNGAGKNNKKQQKQKEAAAAKKKKQQSQAARNAFRAVQ